MFQVWEKRKLKLESDFAITAWALCVLPEVRADVEMRFTGVHHDVIDGTIEKLYARDVHANLALIKDTFFTDLKKFRSKKNPYDNPSRWNVPDVVEGRSYLWHDKYSSHHCKVLGFVACRSTSKRIGIGSAERSWGDVKHLKSGKRSHLSAKAVEQQSILYSTARITDARIAQKAMESNGNGDMFGDDDIRFDLQLDNFGVDTSVLKKPAKQRFSDVGLRTGNLSWLRGKMICVQRQGYS